MGSGNTLNDSQLEVLRIGIADLALGSSFARNFVRNEEDVDDLVQETMLRGLRSLHGFTRHGFEIVALHHLRNTFCTRYKVSKRECVGLPVGIEQTMSTPASQEWRVQHREVMRAMQDLDKGSEWRSSACRRRDSYSDAAAICGCRVGTIKSRVNRRRRTASAQS